MRFNAQGITPCGAAQSATVLKPCCGVWGSHMGKIPWVSMARIFYVCFFGSPFRLQRRGSWSFYSPLWSIMFQHLYQNWRVCVFVMTVGWALLFPGELLVLGCLERLTTTVCHHTSLNLPHWHNLPSTLIFVNYFLSYILIRNGLFPLSIVSEGPLNCVDLASFWLDDSARKI